MVYTINIHHWVDVLLTEIWQNRHSETQQRYIMNLHEECLLKYLKTPDELSYSTDILKLNNEILEQHFLLENILIKNLSLGYNRNC